MNRTVSIIVIVVIALCVPLAWAGGAAGAVLVAAIIVTIAGGAIAYLGDVIGYSLGKKRVSLFNLRPRDTAKLIGVGAGIVSALAAAIFLLTIDAAFRRALFKGNELAHTLHQLGRQNETLKQQIRQSGVTLVLAEQDKTRAQHEQALARSALILAKGDLANVRADLRQADSAVTSVTAQLAGETDTLKQTKANLAAKQADLDKARISINAVRAQALDFERRNRLAKQQYLIIEAQIQKVEAEASPVIANARGSVVIYRNGQEVGRCVIHNGPKILVIRTLNGFLDTLSAKAQAAGAQSDGDSRAVRLAPIRIFSEDQRPDERSVTSTYVGEDESISALAEQISSSSFDSVVVIANAVGNSFAKTPVLLQLRPYRNRLVIPAGTVLAETVVHNNGSLDPEEVINSVQRLLIAKVRPSAMSAGVIPVLESANSDAQLGDLPIGDLLRIVLAVQSVRGDAVIRATAAADIWSGDQLQLRFTVSPSANLSTSVPGTGLH